MKFNKLFILFLIRMNIFKFRNIFKEKTFKETISEKSGLGTTNRWDW